MSQREHWTGPPVLDAHQALDLIDAQLRLLSDAGFTGSLVLNFQRGMPRTCKVERHHGIEDGFAFASGVGLCQG